jgi:O-antigen/teichoic acid export membrane protein
MSRGGDRERLAHRTAWGVVWAVTGNLVARTIGLVTIIVFARLLTPGEYGLFAFCLIYIAYVETIGDLGTGMALVYWPTRIAEAAQITFIVNLATGAALTLLTLLAAPAAAALFHMQGAEPLLGLLAWSFLVRGLGNTHDALCRKQLRFRARLVAEVGLATVKLAVAVALVLRGHGVWSLAWGQLAGVTVWTVALWFIVPWRPTCAGPATSPGPCCVTVGASSPSTYSRPSSIISTTSSSHARSARPHSVSTRSPTAYRRSS